MIDGIAYFTGAICVPSGNLEGIPYFTNGLCIPTDDDVFGNGPGGGLESMRIARRKFVRKAKREAEDINVILMMVSVIEEDR